MTYAKAMDALGNPTRREIMERLRTGPRAVGEIAAGLPISRPAVSQHLRVLKEAGLVAERKGRHAEDLRRRDEGDRRPARVFRQFLGAALAGFKAAAESERRTR